MLGVEGALELGGRDFMPAIVFNLGLAIVILAVGRTVEHPLDSVAECHIDGVAVAATTQNENPGPGGSPET